MNIPQGYKQTELGIIPEDWEVVNLGNVAKVNGRIGFRGYTVADLVPKGFGAITLSPSNIINNQIDYSNCTYISWYKYHESPEIKVRNGDILLVKTGSTFGKSAFVKDLSEKATINPQFVLLNNFKCDSRYLSYVIAHDIIQNQIHADIVGGAIPTLSQERIANFTLFVPKDIAEQRAIAEALSDVDGLIAALDKKIAKKRLLKQGAMCKLLSLSGRGKKWFNVRLGNVVNIRKGSMLTSDRFVAGNIPVIAGGKIPAGYHNVANRPANTITISASGASAGYVALYNKPIFATDCSTIEPCSTYDIHYIYHLLKYYQSEIFAMQTGGAQPHVHPSDLNELQILYAKDIEEQRAIATILSDMDKEIADLEAQRDKYRLLKSGMMQKLLTGQIRLKNE